MEKKQTSATTTCSLGPCERLFNAFHINSNIHMIRRLTCRQQEPSAVNGSRLPSPVTTSPATVDGISSPQIKKPPHLQEKHEQYHVTPQINSHEESVLTLVSGKLPSEQPEITGTKASSSVKGTTGGQKMKKKVTVDPKWDKEEKISQATKSKKNFNEKVDDYIKTTMLRIRGSFGRTRTSSKG